jgi:hypothetical protein
LESFEDPLGYPTPITEEKKDSVFAAKLRSLLLCWKTWLSLTLLFAVCLGLFLGGLISLLQVGNETEKAYDPELLTLDQAICEKGTIDEEGEKYAYLYSEADSSSLTVTAPKDKRLVAVTSFAYVFPEEQADVTFTLSVYGSESLISFVEKDTDGNTLYEGSGALDGKHYLLQELLDGEEEPVSDSAVFQTKQDLITSYETRTDPVFRDCLTSLGLSLTKTPDEFILGMASANAALSTKVAIGNNLLLYGTLFGVIFLFLSVFVGILILLSKKKKKVFSLAEEAPDVTSSEQRALKPNLRLTPLLPESFFRLAGVILILTSSILFFNIAHAVINAQDFSEMILAALPILDWIRLMPLIPIATTLWFFIRIEILHTSGNIVPTVILTFFLGLLFYFAENAFQTYFDLNSDTYRELLLTLFLSFMPGNLFWGMTCFSLLVLFLLTTPKFRKRSSLVAFRLCALLPLTYLLLSLFYALGTQLWGFAVLPDEVAGLLSRKEFIPTVFAVLYPLGLYLYRIIVLHRYGKEKAALYFCGNRYFFLKNILASLILGALALTGYLLGNGEAGKALGLHNSAWIAILIPFLLCYHPHLGARNRLLDLLFPLAYAFSLTFAYLYVARFVLFLF